MNEVHDTTKETLTQWVTALTNAFSLGGYNVSWHPSTASYRLGEMIARKGEQMYKITFLRKVAMVAGKRTGFTVVNVFNPLGKLTVNLKGFDAKKVAKIVNYANIHVQDCIARENTIDGKRRRAQAAREQWNAAGITLPDWMAANPNIDSDKDAGTFHAFFYEHRANYGLKRLSLGQIKRLADFVTALVAEPSVEEIEAELVTKLLQHEGKAPVPKTLKYDKKADDKQWMHDTLNP